MQTELQQDIQRVVGVFMDRVSQAGEPFIDAEVPPSQQQDLLGRVLLYNASALDIASGPYAETNVLDMLVFTILSRDALEEHWIPDGLGAAGEQLATAFATTEQELWDVATKFLQPAEQQDLRDLTTSWQAEHPHQYRVEGVRFSEFSAHAGSSENERKTRGLLGHVKSATRAADQALLISERAMFLVHRLPFVMRLQARLGAQETMTDAQSRLEALLHAHLARWVGLLLLAGLGGAAIFWSGYYVVRRLT